MVMIGTRPGSSLTRLIIQTSAYPPARPKMPPRPICRMKRCRSSRAMFSPPPRMISSTSDMVRNTAIGSFEPDSTSSVLRVRSRRLMPPTRNRKNTAAASVELTIAPNKSATSHGTSSTSHVTPPMTPVVIITPMVARTNEGPAAILNVRSWVSKPLSNRIRASAMEPMK